MSANMKMSIDCEIIYKLNEKKILKYNIVMVKLEDYTTTELKKMISSFNKIVKFAGYSKLKKGDLINMIRTHPKVKVEEGVNAVKLSIKTDEDFEKQTKVKKEKVKKEVKKEVEKLDDVKVVVKPLTVTKADGTIKELKMKKKKFNVKPTESQKIAKSLKSKYTDHKKDLSDFSKAEIIGYIKQDIKREEFNLKEINRLLKDSTDKEAIRKSSSADMIAIEKALELYKNDLKELEKKKEEPVNKNEKFIKRFFKKMDGLPVNKDGKEIKITDKDVKQRTADTYRDLVFSLQGEEGQSEKKALKEIRTEKKQVMKLINGAKKNYKLPENSATWELLIERLDGDMTDETLDKNDDDPKEDVFYYNPLNYQRIINYIIKNYLGYKEEPKKEQPEKKKEEDEEDKEKAVDDLLKQIKKSYEKNKPKLDKMTDTKYKDMFNKKLNDLYDDVEDIYQEDLTTEKRFNLRKRFSAIIPFKKEEPKKEKKK